MPWCATTSNYDKDKKWENCLPRKIFPFLIRINYHFHGIFNSIFTIKLQLLSLLKTHSIL